MVVSAYLVRKMIFRLWQLIENLISVYALDIDPGTLDLPTTFGSLGAVVAAALPLIVSGTGLLMFGYLLFGGLKYITAGGDSKQVQEAVKTITNAIIGLAIVFVSFWIVRIIETVFGLNITGYNP